MNRRKLIAVLGFVRRARPKCDASPPSVAGHGRSRCGATIVRIGTTMDESHATTSGTLTQVESQQRLIKVGATRFERATSCSQSRRSSQAELRPGCSKSVQLYYQLNQPQTLDTLSFEMVQRNLCGRKCSVVESAMPEFLFEVLTGSKELVGTWQIVSQKLRVTILNAELAGIALINDCQPPLNAPFQISVARKPIVQRHRYAGKYPLACRQMLLLIWTDPALMCALLSQLRS